MSVSTRASRSARAFSLRGLRCQARRDAFLQTAEQARGGMAGCGRSMIMRKAFLRVARPRRPLGSPLGPGSVPMQGRGQMGPALSPGAPCAPRPGSAASYYYIIYNYYYRAAASDRQASSLATRGIGGRGSSSGGWNSHPSAQLRGSRAFRILVSCHFSVLHVILLGCTYPYALRTVLSCTKGVKHISPSKYRCLAKNTLQRRQHVERQAFTAPNQGPESTFCCGIAGQRLSSKGCFFRHW